MDIYKAIRHLHPKARFTLNGEDYTGLTWLSEDTPKPSKKELEDAWVVYKTQQEKEAYKVARANEFALLDGEGMDAIRKAIESLAGFLVTDLPPEYQAYAGKVKAIKARHPKPVK